MAEDAEYFKKVTRDLSTDIDDVSKSLRDVSRLQTGIIKGFTEITKTSTATGQAWISVARFFSGSGFWKVQNKIKSVSNLLQAAQKLEEKREEAMAKQIDDLASQEANYKRITEMLLKIQNLHDGELSYEETKLLYNNKYFKLLKMQFGFHGALLIFRNKLIKSQEKLKVLEGDQYHGQVKAHKAELKRRSKLSKLSRQEYHDFKRMNKDQQTLIARFHETREKSKLASTKEEKADLIAERKLIVKEMKEAGLKTSGYGYGGKTKKGVRGGIAGKSIDTIEPYLGPLDRISGAFGKMNDFFKVSSVGLNTSGKQKGGDIGGATFADFWQSFDDSSQLVELTEFQNRKELGKEKWRKWMKRVFMFFTRKFWATQIGKVFKGLKNMDWKRIGNTMLNVGKFVGKFLLLIPFIIMFIFFLKKVGIIDLIKDIAGTIFETLGAIFFYGGKLIGTILHFAGTVVDFFSAIFNGDMGQAWDALVTMLWALWDVIWVFGEFLIMGIIVPFFGGLLGNLWDWFIDFFTGGKTDLFSIMGGLVKLVITIAVFVTVMAFLLPLLPGMMGVAIALGIAGLVTWAVYALIDALGEKGTKIVGGAAGGALVGSMFGPVGTVVGGVIGGIAGMFMEKGGIKNQRGPTIVGERGPELLHLPAGARIQSNAVSRNKMGGSIVNNFTIQVQGRIGASDTEIRQITDKISRQLQREINRTTSIR